MSIRDGACMLLGKGEAKLLPLSINELANDVLELVERNVAGTTRLAPGLLDIHGDRVQLQQVLSNLIMNACEAMTGNGARNRGASFFASLPTDAGGHA